MHDASFSHDFNNEGFSKHQMIHPFTMVVILQEKIAILRERESLLKANEKLNHEKESLLKSMELADGQLIALEAVQKDLKDKEILVLGYEIVIFNEFSHIQMIFVKQKCYLVGRRFKAVPETSEKGPQ